MNNVKYHGEIIKLILKKKKSTQRIGKIPGLGQHKQEQFQQSAEERNQVAMGGTENWLLWGSDGEAYYLLKKLGFENKTVMRFPKGQWHVYMSKRMEQLEKLKERKLVSDKTKISKW